MSVEIKVICDLCNYKSLIDVKNVLPKDWCNIKVTDIFKEEGIGNSVDKHICNYCKDKINKVLNSPNMQYVSYPTILIKK